MWLYIYNLFSTCFYPKQKQKCGESIGYSLPTLNSIYLYSTFHKNYCFKATLQKIYITALQLNLEKLRWLVTIPLLVTSNSNLKGKHKHLQSMLVPRLKPVTFGSQVLLPNH